MKQYLTLMQHVLDNGIRKEDRTGVGTISVFGYQMRFNLSDIAKFTQPMFADLMGNLADGHKTPQWQTTNPAE